MNKRILLNYAKQNSGKGGLTPTGSINITENGEYDVTNYAEANVNVPVDTTKYFRNTISNGNSSGSGLVQMIKEIPEDTTISGTSCAYMFFRAFNLVRIPNDFDTTGSTSFQNMFAYCESLIDLPILNSASVNNLTAFVYDCNSLSNESLNNVLKICINATSYQSTKTLKNIGISSEQATICTTLSNWPELQSLGWTTGY